MSKLARVLSRVWPGSSKSRAAVKSGVAIVQDDYYMSRAGVAVVPDDTSGDLPLGVACESYTAAEASADGVVNALFDRCHGTVKRFIHKSVRSATGGTITITGSSGSLDTLTIGGVEVLGAAITYATSTTATAAAIAAQINLYCGQNGLGYWATSSSNVVTVRTLVPATGTIAVVATATTLGAATVDLSAGYGLTYAANEKAVYAVNGGEVKRTGNVMIGKIIRVSDENGDIMTDEFGVGSIELTGTAGTMTSLKADSTQLLAGTITWTTSLSNTALLTAASINLGIGTHGYFAWAVGAVVYIRNTAFLDQANGSIVITSVTAGGLALDNVHDIEGGLRARCDVELKAMVNV